MPASRLFSASSVQAASIFGALGTPPAATAISDDADRDLLARLAP